MMSIRWLLPSLALVALGAAEQAPPAAPAAEPAVQAADAAVLATAPGGTRIGPGQPFVATRADAVTRLDLAGFAHGHLDLRPGSQIVLSTEAGRGHAADQLVIAIESGAARIDVHGTGPYSDLRVRGAALDVTVTGTLFVVERVTRDQDYLALIRGRLAVALRKAVADALHQDPRVELISRQALAASTGGGLGEVTTLSNAPVLGTRSDDGTAADDPFLGELQLELPPPVDAGDDLFGALSDDVGASVLGELSGAGSLTGEVLSTGAGAFTLSAPPPPP